MSDELLTVAALRTMVEAELLRSKLEKAGIAAVLLEPEPQPDGAPAARVQVQVGQPDFERAMQLLFPIPQRARPTKTDKPNWKCPQCGEQVMGQFPACWKCGTTRDGVSAPSGMSLPSAAAGAAAPPMWPSLSTPSLPGRPMPPPPPLSPAPQSAARSPASPLDAAPRISMPASASVSSSVSMPGGAQPPPLDIPPIPLVAGAEPSKPATNGESTSKAAVLATARTRTADEEGLKIVVPAWDAASSTGKNRRATRPPTDADDRAARRAWWTAVLGIVLWPLLVYSIGVVLLLGLTGRELSPRGTRFFYGALLVNALIIAVAFAWLGIHR